MQRVKKLVKNLIPENYNLSLVIDRKKRIFTGTLSIIGESIGSHRTIEFHSKDLVVSSVLIDGKSSNFATVDDILTITPTELTNKRHNIVIVYSGKITDAMHGMYPCYFDNNGDKKELIATQFESHHAREVLPCIDEPGAKATFDVTLTTEPNVTVLGNMPIKFQRQENNNLITCFETTPKMSVYLLAWVVGEMHSKSAQTKDGVEVNVWSTPVQSLESLDFALDIAVRSIEFFNDYFGTPYPLKKCDHVALPDFSSGAMENWGLITYREVALLVDPTDTSISSKRYVATVIAHELSHQWFGNLVTMAWWNDLWLNESFASLIEYTAIDKLEPSWNVWLDFASSDVVSALKRDSIDGVQPVQIDVNHPDEISTLFDGAIVYAKGARLLQMLAGYIGETNFKNGLRLYFEKFAYQNTIDQDLWHILGDTSQLDIANFMKPWLTQPGFPVVHASLQSDSILLTQEKIGSFNSKKSNVIWPIPLNSNYDNAPKLLAEKTAKLNIDTDKTFRLNVGNSAHFIAHYDDQLFKQILTEVKNGNLSAIDRLQLINEQTILADVGIVSHASLLETLTVFSDETNEQVWNMIAYAISAIKKFIIDDQELESKFKKFINDLIKNTFDRLGWDKIPNEPEADTELRSLIIGLMSYSEDESIVSEAINRFNSCAVTDLDPELRSVIIATAVRESETDKIIDSLLGTYSTTNSPEVKLDITAGLTATKSIKTAQKTLGVVKAGKIIRPQDSFRWIVLLLRNKYCQEFAWQWMRENWLWIETNFKGDKSYDDYPKYAGNSLYTQKQLDEFTEFFQPMINIPALSRVITVAINEISDRVALIKHDGERLKNALRNL